MTFDATMRVVAPGSLRFGALGGNWVHLCIDMQNLFAEGSEWNTPWLRRVLPRVAALVERWPDRTVFTRFVPPHRAEQARGSWRRYYQAWQSVTGERLAAGMLDVLPELRALAPEAPVFDKDTYSPWVTPELAAALERRGVDTVVISGAETDVCVLAAVLGAVDRGFRVVVPTDAVCSSTDHTHDALLALYHERFSHQIEAATTEQLLQGT